MVICCKNRRILNFASLKRQSTPSTSGQLLDSLDWQSFVEHCFTAIFGLVFQNIEAKTPARIAVAPRIVDVAPVAVNVPYACASESVTVSAGGPPESVSKCS